MTTIKETNRTMKTTKMLAAACLLAVMPMGVATVLAAAP
jgi:hypothetical protein